MLTFHVDTTGSLDGTFHFGSFGGASIGPFSTREGAEAALLECVRQGVAAQIREVGDEWRPVGEAVTA